MNELPYTSVVDRWKAAGADPQALDDICDEFQGHDGTDNLDLLVELLKNSQQLLQAMAEPTDCEPQPATSR